MNVGYGQSQTGQTQYGYNGQVSKYGTQTTVSQLNYAASLFKSQNSSTWVPAPSETLCFNLKICNFIKKYNFIC